MSSHDAMTTAPLGDLEHLVSVLSERWVLTLSTLDPSGLPYATPLYFALHRPPTGAVARQPPPALVFASSPTSTHGQHLGRGPTQVAGAVSWETAEIGSLRGVQLRGAVMRDDSLPSTLAVRLRLEYLERHPVAAPMLSRGDTRLYSFTVSWAKLTDNRLGMGVHPVFDFGEIAH